MNFRSLFGPSQDAHIDGELLSAYLDGQVKPDELRRVETHLGTCPACQSELASLRQTVTMLHALPRVPVPRAFTLSEAQVGLRRPAPAGGPTWFGGMARGLAAVSAVALVAVMAAVLLRQPSWQPSQNIAQLAAPAPAAEAPAASALAASAATADAVIARVEPTDTAQASKAAGASGAPVTAQAPQAQAATKAPAPAAAPLAAGTQIAKLPEKPAEKPATAIVEAQPSAAKAQADQPAPPSAAAAVPVTPLPTDRPTAAPVALAAAAAPPTATLAVARAASEPGLAAAAAGRSSVTSTAVSTTTLSELPAEASLVYADARGLWALDRTAGVRPLVQAAGVTAPAISGDRAWVAYRLVKGNSNEVWAVPSSGGDARLLLAERDLSAGLPQGYRERRIQDVRWLPGKQVLLVTTQLTPVCAGCCAPA